MQEGENSRYDRRRKQISKGKWVSASKGEHARENIDKTRRKERKTTQENGGAYTHRSGRRGRD